MSTNEQVRMKLSDARDEGWVEFADMSWTEEIYIAMETPGGFNNIIIKREDLEKFMKASKPKKLTTRKKLNALKIGTRFTTESNNEYIKVGDNNFIETDEELAVRGMKWHPGFVHAEDFGGKITVVDD